jgi:hypothetical protein
MGDVKNRFKELSIQMLELYRKYFKDIQVVFNKNSIEVNDGENNVINCTIRNKTIDVVNNENYVPKIDKKGCAEFKPHLKTLLVLLQIVSNEKSEDKKSKGGKKHRTKKSKGGKKRRSKKSKGGSVGKRNTIRRKKKLIGGFTDKLFRFIIICSYIASIFLLLYFIDNNRHINEMSDEHIRHEKHKKNIVFLVAGIIILIATLCTHRGYITLTRSVHPFDTVDRDDSDVNTVLDQDSSDVNTVLDRDEPYKITVNGNDCTDVNDNDCTLEIPKIDSIDSIAHFVSDSLSKINIEDIVIEDIEDQDYPGDV